MHYRSCGENSLIIKKGQYRHNVLIGNDVKYKDMIFQKVTNEQLNNLLEDLKGKGLDYFIRGFNNEYICTQNMGQNQRTIGGYHVSASRIGWTRGVPSGLFEYIYSNTYCIGKFTIRDYRIFMMFISECLQGNNILKKNEVPKNKYYPKKGGKNPRIQGEINVFNKFVDKIKLLLDSNEDEDQQLLASYLGKYDIGKMLEISELEKDKQFEILSCIYNENNYKILSYFII